MRYSEIFERVEVIGINDLGSRRGSRNTFKLYSNPSPSELGTLAKTSGNKIRFCVSSDGALYMWNKQLAIHDDVLHLAGIDQKFGGYIVAPDTIMIPRDESPREMAPLLRANPHILKVMSGPNFRVMRNPAIEEW